jgi:hypothetical protein
VCWRSPCLGSLPWRAWRLSLLQPWPSLPESRAKKKLQKTKKQLKSLPARRAIAHDSGIAFSDMLFFDNELRNCQDCAPLGITCCYTPDGAAATLLRSVASQGPTAVFPFLYFPFIYQKMDHAGAAPALGAASCRLHLPACRRAAMPPGGSHQAFNTGMTRREQERALRCSGPLMIQGAWACKPPSFPPASHQLPASCPPGRALRRSCPVRGPPAGMTQRAWEAGLAQYSEQQRDPAARARPAAGRQPSSR